MLRTSNADIQAMADKFNRPAYLVRITDSARGCRVFCEEECFTTDKSEADAWANQWREEYQKEDGYTLTRKTFEPTPVAQETPKAINITPTWESLLHVYIAVLRDGNAEGRRIATEELRRMARAADQWNAHCNDQGA